MNTLYLVAGLTFLAVSFTAFSIYLLLFGSKLEISKRAVEVVGQRNPTIREKELSEPIVKRVLKPFLNRIIKLTSRLLPSEKEAALNKKIIAAGKPGGHGPKEFIAIKIITALSGAGILILTRSLLNWESGQWIMITAAVALAGWSLPDFYLRQRINERKSEVEKNLPDVLDLITVSVEAGMGFDGSLLKVVEKGKGILSSEFLVVLQECKMGKSRKDALKDMASRVDVDDLSTFVGSIVMAEQLGIGIGNVMRLQSDQMRRKRRQRAEERAMKAPVKIMIPMVTCIFPTIFVVLLGPAAITLYQAFVT